MKTFILHYSPLTLRKQHILSEIQKHKLNAIFIEVEEGPGVYHELQQASVSLFYKHIEAWRQIVDGTDDFSLVLEDDAILDDEFVPKLNKYISQLPTNFDMMFIGNGCNMHLDIPPGTIGLKQSTRCTDSYIISKTCAAKLLKHVRVIIYLPIDHWINEVARRVVLNLRIYWCEPTIVSQGSENGLFQSCVIR